MIQLVNIFVGNELQDFAKSVFLKSMNSSSGIANLNRYCSFMSLFETSEKGSITTTLGQYTVDEDSRYNILIEEDKVKVIENNFYDEKEMKNFWRSYYTNHMTIDLEVETVGVKVVVFLPLYVKGAWDRAKQLAGVLKTIDNQNYSLIFVGISTDLSEVVYQNEDRNFDDLVEEESLIEKEIIKYETDCQKRIKERFIVLQNRTTNGRALDFDFPTLSEIVAEFCLVMTQHGPRLFPDHFSNAYKSGIGVSVLQLDKAYFVSYLIRKAFLHVLDAENVNQKKVQREVVEPIVQSCIRQDIDVYHRFWNQHIKPLLEKGKSHEDIVATITPLLEDHFKELSKKFQEFLDNQSDKSEGLSIPEKQAGLALLLLNDDELLEGNSYNKDSFIVDDAYISPAQMLVEENNKLVTVTTTVDSETNVKNVVVNSGPIRNPIDDNGKVHFQLGKIKEMKEEILQNTNDIRKWEADLKQLESISKIEKESKKRLTNDGYVFGNVKYRLIRKQIENALETTYDASGISPKKNVDLRANFTPVKNQGSLGSCSVFAISSIYEYILKKKEGKNHDLSERFVFWETNLKDGKEDEGTSYSNVIDVISKKGICDETKCPYNEILMKEEPSAEAYEDALKHQIVEAKNVNVKHHDITAALSEGYPVAISLRMYDGFGSGYKGIIKTPVQEDLDNSEEGHHALVLCGYSEEDHIYIVRNSWGSEFGDSGYCYIPFSYIDDPSLNTFSCIITSTNDGEVKSDIDGGTSVKFDLTDESIRRLLLEIKIAEEQKKVEEMEAQRSILQMNYEHLLLSLESQSVRNAISRGADERLQEEIKKLNHEYGSLNESLPGKKRDFKKETMVNTLKISACLLLFLCLAVLFILNEWHFLDLDWIFTGCTIVSIIVLLVYRSYRHHRFVRYSQELEDEKGNVISNIQKREKERETIKLRLHFAGMVIDRVSKLKNALKTKYHATQAYIGNLRVWYDEEKERFNKMQIVKHPPILGILDNDVLDKYFKEKGDDVMKGLLFSDYLMTFEPNEENAKAFKEQIRQDVIDKLQDVVSKFDIADYFIGRHKYEYINAEKIVPSALVEKLDKLSSPFIQKTSTDTGSTQLSKYVFVEQEDENQQNISSLFRDHYREITPTIYTLNTSSKIISIQIIDFEDNE